MMDANERALLRAQRSHVRDPIIIKKYSNRRLYATDESRYVTLEELAEKVRKGRDIKVLDASSGDDLTQVTLTQIILESRGAGRLLPVPFLLQLVRMGDDALAEFFGRYLGAALELYLAAREGTRGVIGLYPPLGRMPPLSPNNPITRFFSGLYAPFVPDLAEAHRARRRWEAEVAEELKEPPPAEPPPIDDEPEPERGPVEPNPTNAETLDMLSSLEQQLMSLRRSILGRVKREKKK